MSSRCKSCGAPITWAITGVAGRAMPLDAAQTEKGNIILKDGKAIVVKAADKAEGELFYTSHFATCPNSKKHRSPKGGGGIGPRVCPFDGCTKRLPAETFACFAHWRTLIPSEAKIITDAYHRYQENEIGVEELRRIQQGVLDRVQQH